MVQLLQLQDKIRKFIKDETIGELHIIEGKPIVLGILEKLDTPIIMQGIKFYEGVTLQTYHEFDKMKREHFIEIVHVLEAITETHLLPSKEKDTMYQNQSFRLLISDSHPNRFHILLRKFSNKYSVIE